MSEPVRLANPSSAPLPGPATLGFLLTIPFLLALAGPLPLAGVVAAAALAGIGIEIFGIMWDTTMQQEISQEKLSRVYSYDALGSFVLIPLGLAVAGPTAELSARARRSSVPRRSA